MFPGGRYATNEKGQHMFPRRYFFEQICGVIASSIEAGGAPIPVCASFRCPQMTTRQL